MRIRVVTLLLFLLLAPSAHAGVRWVVKGHGFGHGVGMSQYGAYGYAKQGRDYGFILRHYYSGTRIGRLKKESAVRVLVDVSAGDVTFGRARQACGRKLAPNRSYVAHRAGGLVRLRSSAGRPLASCGRRLRATGSGWVRIGGSAYRGALEVVPTASDAGSLNAVNAVPVDQYVKGVIANEVPASWPMAALRAQAVATRSYAIASRVDGHGFDLYDDTRSQVYGGIASEERRGNRAAESTRGQVVLYRGKVAQTFFSACSGGHTESVQNVFFGPPVPYLVGVPDPYDYHCPLHTWTLRFSGREISARLAGHLNGQLARVVVTKRGSSPRIVWARLHGTGGVTTIRGDQLASALGAYDRWMTFRKIVNGKVVSGGGGDGQRGEEGGVPVAPTGGAAP
jgi:SpoIID/LytB domain protein